MTLGTSLLVIAVGAVLRFAVSVHTKGFNLHTAGVILMVAGVVGLVISLLHMAMLDRRRRRRAVVAEDPDVLPRTRRMP
ncbi:MAG: hypothetical protein JO168_24695 [Solirubrobacterales bacterium]|nr:hypothetical protein [Solirubrobacterales bacterium]MBV9713899.1 hypothetical protein [Solirubrobacterales bacterium]